MISNRIQKSFDSGELAPNVHGLYDLDLYAKGLFRCQNFIIETQGPARFRTGSRVINHTRLNKIANIISFQFNDEQAYMLEFTDLFMRVFKDEGVVLEANQTITTTTNATPVVVAITGHNYSDGDEVFISGVATAADLNGKYFIVANSTANDFEITDIDGNNIVGTAAGTGGTSGKVFELATPYLESELFAFDFDQNADTLTITHNKHDIRNLTRTGHAAWTLSKFTRTNDPFPSLDISGISQADPGVVTYVGADEFVDGDTVTIQEVVGMVEVNGNSYVVANVNTGANTFELTDSSGANVDTSGFTLYGSAGTVGDYPAAVGYYEGRRFYGGTLSLPETFWGTRGPDSSADGLPRYDDHTAGTDNNHALIFTISPTFEGTVNKIEWIAGMNSFMAIGTFGGINKVTGSGQDEVIAPDSINVKAISDVGSATNNPIPRGGSILYIQRGKLKLRSLEFDALTESFLPVDRNFVANHITRSGIVKSAFQDGEPDILWSATTDGGLLLGLTFKSSEAVSGWHRHVIGGTDVKVLSVGSLALPAGFDQLWMVVERTINGLTRRHIEFFEDDPDIPQRVEFKTGDTNKTADDAAFANAMFEAQKDYMYVDSAISFDGSLTGSDAGAMMTPASTSGTSVTFTASAAVFTDTATDAGKEIWKKSIKGIGDGRATIVTITDTTHAVCNITKTFDSVTAMAAGNWYLTANTLGGFDHLEGETLTLIADGAEHPQKTVSSGSITLNFQASKVHGGLGYIGRLITLNLESGGLTGPAQTKPRNIAFINARFFNTLRARFGTDLYNLEEMGFRDTISLTDRPQPLFSGVKNVTLDDEWEKEKQVIIEQIHPSPCVVQALDIFMETADE